MQVKPQLKEILDVTLFRLKVDPREWAVSQKCQNHKMTKVKQLFSLAAFKVGYSHNEISNFIRLHRTTVIYHINVCKNRCDVYKDYRDALKDVMDIIMANAIPEQKVYERDGWIARNRNGQLIISTSEPKNIEGFWIALGSRSLHPQNSFPQISNESDPVKVRIKISIEE